MRLEKTKTETLQVVTVKSGNAGKITLTANLAENPERVVKQALKFIKSENAGIISGFAFGGIAQLEKILPNDSYFPVTCLQGDFRHRGTPTAIQLTAISGTEISPVTLDGNRVGSTFIFDGHKHCVLSGVHATASHPNRGDDVAEAFKIMSEALRSVGFDFSNVIRMWNYLDELLDWYDEFNSVRNAFFAEHSVYDSLVPAGTGIGAVNRFGTAYIGDLWAVEPLNSTNFSNLAAFAVPSPLQCPAIDYKSSFSRAVELVSGNFRTLCVSGTASIESGGETVFPDDTAKQIDKTLQVISAILESRDMEWSDTIRAIAYFADIDDLPLLAERMEANNIPPIQMAISHAAICRDDLLFEIELDAVTHREE
ncbi:MAG: translation initiation inhibitor [Kiritimatiellaeota bacterium]|nr:translation initiation inhibitor [Kiritimatiellota bacterium]